MNATNIMHLEAHIMNYTPIKESLSRFRKWHVESLLNQAADLLDRALRDRSEWYDLKSKWDLLQIEKEEARKTLHAMERQMKKEMWGYEKDILDRSVSESKGLDEMYRHALIASDTYRDSIDKLPGDPPPHYYSAIAEMVRAQISERLHLIDRVLKEMRQKQEVENIAERFLAKNELEEIRKAKDKLLEDNPQPIGPGSLYLKPRLEAIRTRFTRDYKDAYDRLVVAQEGLDELYGYFDLPNTVKVPGNGRGQDNLELLDQAVVWVRDAIRWLVGFGHLDQAWTAIFSIRKCVGTNVFDPQIAKNEPAVFRFKLPAERFDSHAFVRLRGMALFAVADKLISPLHGSLRLPDKATTHHLGRPKPQQLDQSDLPACYFGRIESRQSPRSPEIAGMISLINASPISQDNAFWELTIHPSAMNGFGDMKDIELELNLLGRPLRIGA